MTFDDRLLLRQGLEYSVILPCGHVVKYLNKETALVYQLERCAKVLSPKQGPQIPKCFEDFT